MDASQASAIEMHNVSKKFNLHQERARSFHELVSEGFRPWRRRSWREVWALRDVNLTIFKGETLGLIGPNGAGKSTILKIIARVLEPDTGQVISRGKVSSLLELGTGFHPDLTGRENVFLYGSLLGLSRREMEDRFDTIVDFSGIGSVIDVPVKQYSSGMYLRLAFSVAIHVEPDVLLVDEVFAVGDHAYQEQCLRRIRELQRQGITILFVSHNMGTIKQMCSRAAWIARGHIMAEGIPEQIIDQYLNQAVPFKTNDRDRTQDISGVRWGTHEVEITRITFLDPQGRECNSVPVGSPLHIQIDFVSHKRIERPVFGLAIYRNDGIHVNGPNTRLADLPIEYIEGKGSIEYKIDHIPLLPGGYLLSAAIHDWEGLHAYDYWHQAAPFLIEPGDVKEIYGLVHMPAHWKLVCGDIERETDRKKGAR